MEAFNIIWQILASPLGILVAIFFFGASIFVHEYGHYLAARWRGLKIERFSIGMGPKLFGWTDKQGVEWRLSLFPIGGYVLLPQLADMAAVEGRSQQPARDLPELSWTDKVTVAVAGAVFNIIFAFVLATILWTQPLARYTGSSQIAEVRQTVQDFRGEEVPGPAWEAGLRPGDRIVEIDGEPIESFRDILFAVTLGKDEYPDGRPRVSVTYLRDGEREEVTFPAALYELEKRRHLGIQGARELVVGGLRPNSPALRAGLEEGDEIVSINGERVYHPLIFEERIDAAGETPVQVTLQRGEERIEKTMTPIEVPTMSDGTTSPEVGIQWAPPAMETFHMPPWEQISEVVVLTWRTLGALISPSSDVGFRAMSGPVGILNEVRRTVSFGWVSVFGLIILINVNLAILNLLPLPILDGGHIALATYRKLVGRPVPPRIVASLQGAMIVLLLVMVLYVTTFDVRRAGRSERATQEQAADAAQRVEIVFPDPAAEES